MSGSQMFSPDQLAAVGYTPQQAQAPAPQGQQTQVLPQQMPQQQLQVPQGQQAPQSQAQMFSPQQLASVGYRAPQVTQSQGLAVPSQPQQAPPGLIPQVTQGLNDLTTASVGELGSLGAGAIANTGKLIGNPAMASYAADQNHLDNVVANARAQSPIMGGIGKIGTDVVAGGLSTVPAAAVAGSIGAPAAVTGLVTGAISGAIAGLATSTGSGTGVKIGVDSLLGAAGMGAAQGIGALAPTAQRILTAGKLWLTDPNTLASKVLTTTLGDAGGDISKLTPLALGEHLQGLETQAKATQQVLYAARNAQAEAEGATVTRDTLASTVANYGQLIQRGAIPEVKTAAQVGKGLLGIMPNAPLSFSDTQDMVSSLGAKIKSANNQGNAVLAQTLQPLKDALETDMDQSATVSPKLLDLQQSAANYTRDIYKPIQNLDIDKAVVNKYTDAKLLGTMANKVLDNPQAVNALNTVDPNTQAMAITANINNIMRASTDGVTGKINLGQFSNKLGVELRDNGAAYGGAADGLLNAAKALSVAGGAPSTLGQARTITKPLFLYGASKLLANPAVSDLLDRAQSLNQYPNSFMAKAVNSNIAKAFGNAVSDISQRLIPAFATAATNTITQ